jgi:hypothetical protein
MADDQKVKTNVCLQEYFNSGSGVTNLDRDLTLQIEKPAPRETAVDRRFIALNSH